MTQLELNAKILNIIRITLFFANYNKKSNLFEKERKYLIAQLVIKKIATLKKVRHNIARMQNKLVKFKKIKKIKS